MMPVSCRHASSAIGPGTRRRRRVTIPTAVCPSSSNLHRGSTPRWTTCAPRSPARSTSNRAWPCSSPPARGDPSCSRGQLAEALGWLTGALHRCPEVSALRTRALFAKGVLHLRRADLEPVAGVAHAITEASQGLGDDAMAIALDQESIFMLMAHDWAEREATFDGGTGAGGVATGDRRRCPPLRGRPGAGARRGGRRPGSVATRRAPRSTVCPRRHRRSSPR